MTPTRLRHAPKARFAGRPTERVSPGRPVRSLRVGSVKIGPRQSRTRVALHEPKQDVVAPSPVDLEKTARVALAQEVVTLEERDRWRIFRDAGGFDPVQPQLGEREFNRHRDRARHAPSARMRGSHPVAKRSALRHPAPHPAEGDSPQKFIIDAVENEKRISFVPSHVVVLALEAPAKCGAGQIVVRPCWFPRLKKTAACRAQLRPRRIVGKRRRPQIEAIAAEHRLRRNRSRQAEQRHHTPFKAAAIFAWPGALPTAPIIATAGGDLSMAAPALRTSSTVTASTRASISSKDSGRP